MDTEQPRMVAPRMPQSDTRGRCEATSCAAATSAFGRLARRIVGLRSRIDGNGAARPGSHVLPRQRAGVVSTARRIWTSKRRSAAAHHSSAPPAGTDELAVPRPRRSGARPTTRCARARTPLIAPTRLLCRAAPTTKIPTRRAEGQYVPASILRRTTTKYQSRQSDSGMTGCYEYVCSFALHARTQD